MKAIPISEYIHYHISQKLRKYDIKTVLDMGGRGRMKRRDFEVTNADIKYGIDGRDLPFEDNSFDATISINTLEHVGGILDQAQFISEAIRVAKVISVHHFPINDKAEGFLEKIGHNHPCIVPSYESLIETLKLDCSLTTLLSVKDQFLLLATMYPKLNIPELYDYIYQYGEEKYSLLMEIKK